MSELFRAYSSGEINGWSCRDKPHLVKEKYNLLYQQGLVDHFKLSGQTRETAGAKCMLYLYNRAVLGQDTPNFPQAIGDCVSWGAKHASEFLTCSEILGKAVVAQERGESTIEAYVKAARLKFRLIFAPYYYGTGRIYIGGQDNSYEDGSSGSDMAAAVQQFGTLFADEPNVPQYGASVAKDWGAKRSILDQWKPTAIKYLVRKAGKINSWNDLRDAIVGSNLPCTTASNVGYNMLPDSSGMAVQRGQWGHQMSFIGLSESGSFPYAIIQNNWGDVHGHLKDFDDGTDLPVGVLRVHKEDAEKHIAAGETFAYSNFDGFPEQLLDKALFNLI